MLATLLILPNWFVPFLIHYHADVGGSEMPILPAFLGPNEDGLPRFPMTPVTPIPFANVLGTKGRRPGDTIVQLVLHQHDFGEPVKYLNHGWARIWRITYRADVRGPDGELAVFLSRTALVRCEEPGSEPKPE